MIQEQYSNKYMSFEMIEGICCGRYLVSNVDEDAAVAIVRDRLILSKHQNIPLLVEKGAMKTLSKGARDYYASEQGAQGATAVAYVVESKFSEILVNLLINVSFKSHNVPMKAFNKKSVALSWLKNHKIF